MRTMPFCALGLDGACVKVSNGPLKNTSAMDEPGGRPPFSTRRKYRRYNLQYPVKVQFSIGRSLSELHARSRNISLGGMLLESELPIPQDYPVVLNMTLQGKPIVRPLHVTAEGTVVRVEESESGFVIAIECNHPISRIGGLV